MIEWVDEGLLEWGKFYRDGRNELGYPSQSAESRMSGGGGGGCSDGFVPVKVAMMEKAVLALEPDLRLVVKVAYMHNGTREQQARALARELSRPISHGRMKTLIDCAHHAINGIYTGMAIATKSVDMASR